MKRKRRRSFLFALAVVGAFMVGAGAALAYVFMHPIQVYCLIQSSGPRLQNLPLET